MKIFRLVFYGLALVVSAYLNSSDKDDNNGKNKINSNTCMSRTSETVKENIKEICQNCTNSCNENFEGQNCCCCKNRCVDECCAGCALLCSAIYIIEFCSRVPRIFLRM